LLLLFAKVGLFANVGSILNGKAFYRCQEIFEDMAAKKVTYIELILVFE
jgi:hypothetical protein